MLLCFFTSFGLGVLNKTSLAPNLEIPAVPATEQSCEWWTESENTVAPAEQNLEAISEDVPELVPAE